MSFAPAGARGRDLARYRVAPSPGRRGALHGERPLDPGFLIAATLLVLAVVFGGGTAPGLASDVVVQLAAIPALAWGLWRLRERPPERMARLALWWLVLVIAVFALQCLPLPHDIWLSLGGRPEIAAEMQLAGIAPGAHPITMSPYATERMAWNVLPPAALFTCAITLDERDRLRLVTVLFALAAISVVLGLAQVAGGRDSPLRFYEITNPTEAVGFFANRNHYAALLYMVLPLAIAWLGARVMERSAGREVPILRIVALALLVVLLIVGLVLSRSRAGITLGMVAIIAGLLIAISTSGKAARSAKQASRALGATIFIGLVLGVQYGLYGLLERLSKDPFDDARWILVGTTMHAIRTSGFAGSGFGTFPQAYASFESTATQLSAFVNHAHNEWVELWSEGGIAGALIVLAGALTVATRQVPSGNSKEMFLPAERFLWLGTATGVALIAAHSFIDYPARTNSIAAIAAIFLAYAANRTRSRQ